MPGRDGPRNRRACRHDGATHCSDARYRQQDRSADHADGEVLPREPFQMYRREKLKRERRFAEPGREGAVVPKNVTLRTTRKGKGRGARVSVAARTVSRAALDKLLNLLKIILQGVDDGAHF